MAELINSEIFLDTTKFATRTEPSIPFPISTDPPALSNISSDVPIFSDADITLPDLGNLTEFTFDNSTLDPLEYALYDTLFANKTDAELGLTVDDANPLNLTEFKDYALDYNFDYNFEEVPSSSLSNTTPVVENAGSLLTEPLGDTLNFNDFKDYNFDFLGDTASSDPASSAPSSSVPASSAPISTDEFDPNNFADYNFDFNFEKPIEEAPVKEEYDINDGWLDGVDYVEKTDEEKQKDRDEFQEKWKSIARPPVLQHIPEYNIDLNLVNLFAPPAVVILLIMLVFVPCCGLMLFDDCRERKGKKRICGENRFITKMKQELYERTSSGKWKRLTDDQLCTGAPGQSPLTPGGFLNNVKENALYKEENELTGETNENSLPGVSGTSSPVSANEHRATSPTPGTSCMSDEDQCSRKSSSSKVSKTSMQSKPIETVVEVDRTVDEEVEAVMLKNGDLGDGVVKVSSEREGKSPGTVPVLAPGTSGDCNWALY